MQMEENRSRSVESMGIFPFDQLPPELQTHIFLALDLRSLAAAMRVSPTWLSMIEEPVMWKLKCMRDFPDYLEGTPMPAADCVIPDEKSYKLTLEELEDAVSRGNAHALLRLIGLVRRFTHTNVEEVDEETASDDGGDSDSEGKAVAANGSPPPVTERETKAKNEEAGEKDRNEGTAALKSEREGGGREGGGGVAEAAAEAKLEVADWKQFYRQCRDCIDLNGPWIGEYGSHGKELVHVAHRGYRVLATKVTGDANVPAGKPTFRMTLSAMGDKGKGQMHLADPGYKRPRWGVAYLEVMDKDNFVVKWFYGVHPSQHFDTYYERVKASSSPSKLTEEMEQSTPTESTTGRHGGEGADEEEGRKRKRTRREVTASGFVFRLVPSPITGQMQVEEVDNEDEEADHSDAEKEATQEMEEEDKEEREEDEDDSEDPPAAADEEPMEDDSPSTPTNPHRQCSFQ